jgi:hypothetical protein
VPRIGPSKSSDILTKAFAADPQYVDQSQGTWSRTFDADPSEMERRGIQIVLDHPWAVIVVTFKGLLRNCFWVQRQALGEFLFGAGFDPGRPQVGFSIGQKILSTLFYSWLSLLLLTEFVVVTFIWIGVSLALWSMRRAQLSFSDAIFILLFVPLLLLCATAGPEASDRFRVPAMPSLAIVAASGWTVIVRRRNFRGGLAELVGVRGRCLL